MNRRYWVSWWSKESITETPFPFSCWITGYRNVLHDDPDVSYCAVIDAENEEQVWKAVEQNFPRHKARFCTEKEPDFYPPQDRFP